MRADAPFCGARLISNVTVVVASLLFPFYRSFSILRHRCCAAGRCSMLNKYSSAGDCLVMQIRTQEFP